MSASLVRTRKSNRRALCGVVTALLLTAIFAPTLIKLQGDVATPIPFGDSVHVGWDDMVPQTASNTCGPAVIATLLLWQNGVAPTDVQVALHARLTSEGISLGDFDLLARHHDLPGTWNRVHSRFIPELPTPFIAHTLQPYGHYVIVRNVDDQFVHVTDPALGNLIYTRAVFAELWTHRVYLLDEPLDAPL